jgi:hypothetical protein
MDEARGRRFTRAYNHAGAPVIRSVARRARNG